MALRSPSSSSSSSSFSYGFTYHVFLSFRGSDTRFGFTGNLYKALCDRGIHAFIDDRELQGGDDITPSLVKAIEESRIAIPVFSHNYAFSSFCLDELVNISQCVKAKGQLVLPVFYDVDPSHVRHQIGSYGEAIAKHEARFKNNKEKYTQNMERLKNWKMALNQTANLSGQHFIIGNEYEHEFIEKIVKEVSNKINRVPLHVADYPVGLESRVLQVKSLLDVGSDDGVCMVGICGIGGMGKTTLARAVYNSIADQFTCLCFLDDVREKANNHGLVCLQETLLYETIGEKDIKLGSVNRGISIIKQRLHRKKVLLILDDVDELKQLQVMVGQPDWLGPGSRVIITTRDKHLLASHGVERTYEMDRLNEEEALELLRWKAFKNNRVDSIYQYVLNCAITYASGLPLALEVVGSNLFGKNIEEWKSTLDRYERIPNKEIQKILKVSFDTLEEDEQSVFLDISCCFKRYTLEEVKDILCAHYGYCMKHHIRVLVEKSLIKISHIGFVTLHDLIEDMGKEIVRQESPKEPGKRSRLWFHEDIVQVLEENSGTRKIEIIHLDFPLLEEVVEWKGDEFKKMKNLKTLIIKSGRFSKDLEHLPNSLRVLEWHGYPSPDIPYDFCGKKLSICKILKSCLTSFKLPSSLKRFTNMRVLNLDKCQYLTQIPDVSGLPKLEKFSFEYCQNLFTIHNSVGLLNKLKILNVEGCRMLKSFPPIELTSLQELQLSYCDSLENFPEILGEMKNITNIRLLGTSIKELPISFQNLTGLCQLIVYGQGMLRLPSYLLMMPNLKWIDTQECLMPTQNEKLCSMVSSEVHHLNLRVSNMSDEFLRIGLTWFANVQSLDLSWNNFTILPECIKQCRFLWRLCLDECKCLREIRGIPPNLKQLSAFGCESLTSSCRSMLLNQELHEAGSTQFCLAGTARIPEWFEHQNRGQSIYFWFRNKIPCMALFLVNNEVSLIPKLSINGYDPDTLGDPFHGFGVFLEIEPNHTFLYDLQQQDMDHKYMDKALLKNEWNHAEIMFEEIGRSLTTSPGTESGTHGFELEGRIIESGIHIFKERSSMEDIQFTNPYKKRKLDDDDHYSQQFTITTPPVGEKA